ncbi:hypothetical protein C8F04DRAFT_1091852 [Mycena alexandri]|uniref:DUF6533 domain-containing protein n=1 Tax=Mycena alexandri TaxID=1745969 RepID=A0AAD6T5C6_9AGAR|nr:hypothetical protein C8F04DRAFT_1091852 [Mycena alexandri]
MASPVYGTGHQQNQRTRIREDLTIFTPHHSVSPFSFNANTTNYLAHPRSSLLSNVAVRMSQSSGDTVQLPPELQKQIEVSAYVFAGATAVFIWDILNNLRSEYCLLFKHRLSAATLAYFISRVASLIYVLGFTIFASYPLKECSKAYIAFNSFYPVAVSASAFLFFFRVRAIFNGDRLATILFGCLWLAVLGSSITIPIGGKAAGLGDPTECIVAHVSAYVGSAGIVITVHDTLVFFAISYRLVSNFQAEQKTRGEKVKSLFSGSNLPAFSKSLFEDGQMYYMITVVTNIVATVMIYIPSVSPVYHGFLVVPNVTLTSIMACRVYRNTKLGATRGSRDLTLPTLNPLGPGGSTIPLSTVQFTGQHTAMSSSHIGENDSDSTENKESGREIPLHMTSMGKNSRYSSH